MKYKSQGWFDCWYVVPVQLNGKHSKRNGILGKTPLPFTSLPKNDSRGTAQQRILDLEVVILLYSYNPVHSYRTVETFTSLPEKTQKEYQKYPVSIKAETLYGDAWQYCTRPTSTLAEARSAKRNSPAEEYSLPLATRACSDCSPSGWVAARALQNSSQGRSRLSTWVPRNTNLFLVWE